MKIQGLPEQFWVVVQPTAVSELGDICFSCDFTQFACQVRGGLHEDDIVGIFADENEAAEVGQQLLTIKGGG